MEPRKPDYPLAVASYDDEGVAAAISWCGDHMEKGDILTVWTSLKSNLPNCTPLANLVARHRDVEHITGRGWGTPRGRGPVLMAWPNASDVGNLTHSASRIRALCVINWQEAWLRPWVRYANPTILGDPSLWVDLPRLHPVVEEEMCRLSPILNHSNSITSPFEKDRVVPLLRALHGAGLPMEPVTMEGWAVAQGWSGRNATQLADWVRDINAGKRPRARTELGPSVAELRRRAAKATS